MRFTSVSPRSVNAPLGLEFRAVSLGGGGGGGGGAPTTRGRRRRRHSLNRRRTAA